MSEDEVPERRGLLPRFTLKYDNSFLLSDARGDIQASQDGFYCNDTRLLSRYELSVGRHGLSLLGAAVDNENALFTSHLTNHPLPALGDQTIPQGVIHIERTRFLHVAGLYERITFTNFSVEPATVPLRFAFDADFADIFEVQGRVRPARGETLEPVLSSHGSCLSYRGLDGVVRSCRISFSELPLDIDAHHAEFTLSLARDQRKSLYIEVSLQGAEPPGEQRFQTAAAALRAETERRLRRGAQIRTSGRLFDGWIERSRSDLALLTTELRTGPYPYAGIPWFATEFGRDALVTALQTLWIEPELSAGVLRFLGATQARETSAFRDSQPGKILHEMRRGEMAALDEVPFGRYYGSVDASPLFVMLAGRYEARTGERSLVDELWPHLERALAWIERRLAGSRTGFLDYESAAASGLVNQAWKDSSDSMFHADGSLPRGPIAVVEVQGYVCAALCAMADLLAARDEPHEAERLRTRARELRAAIEASFWAPELGFYGAALDGDGRLCRIRTSNAGHLLYCGVPSAERADLVTTELLSPRFASGWGIRTLASGQARYNPMSYHNGSVWPHDTAICAAGMARYGKRREAVRILGEVFEAASYFGMRVPELYCGFARAAGQGPIPYPVACVPQAWAAGAVFMLLEACLGVSVDGARAEVHVSRPQLPIGIESLTVADLGVGRQTVQLRFQRFADEVVVATADLPGAEPRVLVAM
ncbi:MAG TPA: amylo-alpha-1,6-glucosidase [Steroidobacteraceae bacterium]|jgi:glycogen debranching enzyme|nr:amylo-alpha-1,6-glucosidase [Steroidobacteraceae bacterium]